MVYIYTLWRIVRKVFGTRQSTNLHHKTLLTGQLDPVTFFLCKEVSRFYNHISFCNFEVSYKYKKKQAGKNRSFTRQKIHHHTLYDMRLFFLLAKKCIKNQKDDSSMKQKIRINAASNRENKGNNNE